MDTANRREDILSKWNSYELTFAERDALVKDIYQFGLYPTVMNEMDEWESEAGLYPDIEDPKFAEKIMQKQEFAENKQDSILKQMDDGVNPCDPDKEFELTPVQRFIGRFLSPQCPYLSALLYHGVGVGKTCAAITVAENYLRSYPRRSVIIVAPRNIQPGFRRTIFDDEALKIIEGGANQAKGCTGNMYLKRAGVEFETDRASIIRRINASIQSRYTFLGYIQFHRMIEDILKRIPKGLDEAATKIQQQRLLRREFSGRMVIIDEAHNLRDTPGEASDDTDVAGGDLELSETQAGKKLTPSLLKVLEAAEGMKLVLLTGTPMYNSYREIIFLLKLLLTNDKRLVLSERDIFLPDGRFRPAVEGRKSGEELLGAAASAYVSFMRGENPLSFPVRLKPQGIPTLSSWVTRSPPGEEIPREQGERMLRLPFVPMQFEGDSMDTYERISEDAIGGGGIGVGSIDEMVQAGNWIFPGDGGPQIRETGFDGCFEENTSGGPSQFTSRTGAPTWLHANELGTASPKAKFTIQRAKKAKGVVFIYSRFIKSGALPLALALEANGYTPWGDKKPLLTNANTLQGEGRQCALCEKREKVHLGADHKFVPAKYILITGRASISPNNPVAIQAARAKTNMDGRDVKIIIGSQVASEGVDFRFVREIYVFDAWFHLNKMEQVLGRGIRTCSHALLPQEQRNCTVYLLINTFGEGQDTETADMYMYRRAMEKAIQVGRVTRALKRYALDCNLNRDAIVVTGLDTQRHIDSQGQIREEVDVNDTPYTNLCDWIETCEYTCAKRVDVDPTRLDMTTYDEYAVRWRETELKSAIRKMFEEGQQPAFQLEDILEAMSDIPHKAISGLLADIVGNQSFRLRIKGKEGYIVYRNGYFLFQPDYLSDIRIPLSLRVADVPVKRDSFDPTSIQIRAAAVAAAEGAPAAAPAAAEEGAAAAPAAAEADAPRIEGVEGYWAVLSTWADQINNGISIKDAIPPSILTALESRYTKDEQEREKSWLTMISWLYDHIQSTEAYSDENKATYRNALGKTLLEFIWDESLRPTEQLKLLQGGSATARGAANEQIVKKGYTEAFRYVDPMTGVMKYICDGTPCSDAVVRVFETDAEDPLTSIKADTTKTGQIYGFIVPKSKERRLVFKTSVPPAPGAKPEKGGECAIISTISFHIRMLKDISELLVAEGLPRLILTEDILDEKERKKREKKEDKAAGRATVRKTKVASRTFENAVRACALKNFALRWMTHMIEPRGGKRYFYRPVAALKSGHKGTVTSGKG